MLKHPSRVVLLFFLILPILLFLIIFSISSSLSGAELKIPATMIHIPLSFETEELPYDALAGKQMVLHFNIPENNMQADHIFLYVRHQYAQVYIGDELRWSIFPPKEPPMLSTPGNYWIILHLIADQDAGKACRILLTPVYSTSTVSNLMMASSPAFFHEIVHDEYAVLFLSILALGSGLFMFTLSFFLPIQADKKKSLMCLSIMSVLTGVWKLSGLPTIHMLFTWGSGFRFTPKALYLCGISAFVFLPALGTHFVILQEPGKLNVWDRICSTLSIALIPVLFVGQIFFHMELHSALPLILVENIVFMALLTISVYFHHKKVLYLLPLPLSALADLRVFLITRSSVNTMFFMIVILFNVFFRVVVFIRDSLRQEVELREARLNLLMDQIRPHFIYNTLTSIYYLCDMDPQKAKEVIGNFATVLRGNFHSLSSNTPVPFANELKIAKAYLDVEKTRYEHKLEVTYDIEETEFMLPTLTLQPLVENSVKHGIHPSHLPLRLHISTTRRKDEVDLVIEDNGPGFDPGMNRKPHHGLDNTRKRLGILCHGHLIIENNPEGGAKVIVRVPVCGKRPLPPPEENPLAPPGREDGRNGKKKGGSQG